MLWGGPNSRGRPLNAPAAFIHPCQPIVAREPPAGPGWAHELKHDGYRLQIHVRDGRVRLFTMNGADWSKRYPRIVEEAARIKGSAVMDAEVVCLIKKGVPDFDTLHSRTADHLAVACAFDLLMHDGDDLRRQPLRERKLALSKLLIRSRGGIQYVEHTEGHGEKLFEAVCDLGLEGIVSKRLTSVYRSGPSRTWSKILSQPLPRALLMGRCNAELGEGSIGCGAALRTPKAFRARSITSFGFRSPVAVTLTIDFAISSVIGSSRLRMPRSINAPS
jgi:bifunctional non-homologous end joining protein LigD